MKPSQLAEKLEVSRQALHKNLVKLVEEGLLKKHGKAPHVFYSLRRSGEGRIHESFELFKTELLPKFLKRNLIRKSSLKKLLAATTKLDFKFMIDVAAVYSSKIEGNTLNLNSFLNSREMAKSLRPKEAAEIEDLVKAYEMIRKNVLNEKNVLRAHAMLSKNFVSKARQGVYRKEPIGVFSSRGMEYLAVEPDYVASEMKALFKYVAKLLRQEMKVSDALFWAAWLHLMIALIHPFSDGNGRVARLCEKWFLCAKLGTEILSLPSEQRYSESRMEYYSALKLGVNYWEVDFGKAGGFLEMLPKSLV